MWIYPKIHISIEWCINTTDGSLEDGSSRVTTASPNIFLIIPAISIVKEDAEEDDDCKEHSKKSTYKGLFLALQLNCCLVNISSYI